MARPKAFNRNTALEKAVQVFWHQGFEATTMTDLRKAMGIGRQSLYDTFGDKNDIFAEVLLHYSARGDAWIEHTLGNKGLDGIRDNLLGAARNMGEASPIKGCLLMSTCVEVAPHNPKVARLTERALGRNRAGFAGALRRAQANGELAEDADTELLAAFLTNQLAGMAVLSRAGATREELENIAEMALAAVGA